MKLLGVDISFSETRRSTAIARLNGDELTLWHLSPGSRIIPPSLIASANSSTVTARFASRPDNPFRFLALHSRLAKKF